MITASQDGMWQGLSRGIRSACPVFVRRAYSRVRWFSLRYWFFAHQFRNFPELIFAWHKGTPCHVAIQWNGFRVKHPANQSGLADGLIECWFEDQYGVDGYNFTRGAVIIDAGANIGLFSIQVAAKSPDRQIVAIEPDLECFNCLKDNVQIFSLKNVDMRQVGLGASCGYASFQRKNRSLDNQLMTVFSPPLKGDAVRVLSLDLLIEGLDIKEVALLKMDIEGSEHDVFSTISEDTLRKIDTLVAEYHDNIRPGTLRLMREKLHATHDIEVLVSKPAGNGMLVGRRKQSPRRLK